MPLTVRTNDACVMQLSDATVKASCVLKDITEGIAPLPNVDAETMRLICKYIDRHAACDEESEEAMQRMKTWDREYFKELDEDALFALINATDYLGIDGLLDAACAVVGESIKTMTVDEIRQKFHLDSVMTEENDAAGQMDYALEEAPAERRAEASAA